MAERTRPADEKEMRNTMESTLRKRRLPRGLATLLVLAGALVALAIAAGPASAAEGLGAAEIIPSETSSSSTATNTEPNSPRTKSVTAMTRGRSSPTCRRG